jgi:hypothetical protein
MGLRRHEGGSDAASVPGSERPIVPRRAGTVAASPRGVEHAREVGVRAEGRELSALPLVAIFGANASGKSNVLLAMRWMLHAVTESVTEWVSEPGVPRPAFALDPAARDEALCGVQYPHASTRGKRCWCSDRAGR